MSTLTTDQVLEVLNWRYATKKFDPSKKIDAATWSKFEEALVLAPSSFGLQPWKFVVVTNPDLKKKLVPASWGQTQPSDASHLVVFALKKGLDVAHVDTFLKRQVAVRGGSVEQLGGYRDVIVGAISGAQKAGTIDAWQGNQVYIALGHAMVVAALLGLDTCPMEGIDRAQYDAILGLAGSGYTTLAALPVGYRAADDKYAKAPKVRFEAKDVIQHLA